MTERLNQSQTELVTEREVLEGMSAEKIVDLILAHGETISKYEGFMNLASDVLEGAHGTTVEEVLQKREREKNG